MRVILLIVLVLTLSIRQSLGQTPFDERLTKNYSGVVGDTRISGSHSMRYDFSYVEHDGTVYYYKLGIYKKGVQKKVVPVVVRNLLNSTYFELQFQDHPKTSLMAIYSKTRKWLRVKGIVPQKCRIQNEEWARINGLESYDDLLEAIMAEINRNVDLSCLLVIN